jgi:hypothetical protein
MSAFTNEQHSQINALIDKAVPYEAVVRSVVPIVRQENGITMAHGTGSLLRIADDSFLVTAAHVTDTLKVDPLAMFPSFSKAGVPIHGDVIQHQITLPDVSIVHLKSSSADMVADDKWLRLGDISYSQDLTNALFVLFGFPASLTTHQGEKLNLKTFFHVAPAYEGDTSLLSDFDPQLHFAINGDLAQARDKDGIPNNQFNAMGLPLTCTKADLGGVSGGCVWKILTFPNIPKDSTGAKFVGIVTGTYPGVKCIKATWWKAVIHLIDKNFPELHGPINMWRGG